LVHLVWLSETCNHGGFTVVRAAFGLDTHDEAVRAMVFLGTGSRIKLAAFACCKTVSQD
jgi:hypothetical protein